MQKKNALDAIQDVKNYFMQEYGLVVKVDVYAFNSRNQVSENQAKNIVSDIKGYLAEPCLCTHTIDSKQDCTSVSGYNEGFKFAIYYEHSIEPFEPQTC